MCSSQIGIIMYSFVSRQEVLSNIAAFKYFKKYHLIPNFHVPTLIYGTIKSTMG